MKYLASSTAIFTAFVGAMTTAHAPAANHNSQIEVVSHDGRASNPGQPSNFTGHAQVEQLFAAQGGRAVSGGIVTFQPGARSMWHTHPKGQILIVTAGTGLVQQWGGPVLTMKSGDVVWIPPEVKHWHGATAATSVTHIAIQEAVDGKVVDWLEPVSDQQYSSGASRQP
jgi:4-carboxymuconolactone decarboxylase